MTTTEATTDTELLTGDDLMRLYSEGVRGELIRGVLCKTMPTGQRHGRIVARLVIRLGTFVEPRGLGTLVTSDSGVWLERDPDTVREPDIAFTSSARQALDEDVPGYAEVVPDLVVEVVSPSDREPRINDKARMWLSYGVRLVWVVRPETRTIDVHPADGPVTTLTASDSLDGGDVLPGFELDVSEVFGA